MSEWELDMELTVPAWCRYLADRPEQMDDGHIASAFRALGDYVEKLEEEVGRKKAADLLNDVPDRVKQAWTDKTGCIPASFNPRYMHLEDWLDLLAFVADRVDVGFHYHLSGGMGHDAALTQMHGGNGDWSFFIAPGAHTDREHKLIHELSADVVISEIDPTKAVIKSIDAIVKHEERDE